MGAKNWENGILEKATYKTFLNQYIIYTSEFILIQKSSY